MKIKYFHEISNVKKISKNLLKNTKEILKNGNYTNSKNVKKFEEKFKNFNKSNYCVALNTGTSSLHLGLIALGIKRGDEVILPAISFIASAAAVVYIGAKPKFVDINPDDWLMDTTKIEKKITKKTKAIMPVHLHGLMCDMLAIKKIAKKYKLLIIEDASQAHGSNYLNYMPGKLSDIATFSFYPTKNLGAIGEGGAVITNNKKIAKKIRDLRAWGRTGNNFLEIGYNYRMSEFVALSLILKIKTLKSDIDKRISIANIYKTKIKLKSFQKYNSSIKKHSYHIFAITVNNRKKFAKYLQKKNIDYNAHYSYCLPMLKIFYSKKLNNILEFKNAISFSKKTISIPIYPDLTNNEINYIVNSINKINFNFK